MRKIFCIMFCVLFNILGYGQSKELKKNIEVISFVENNNVLLRWSSSNYISWVRGNQYGYSIYRYSIIKNNKILQNPDTLFLGKIYPSPINSWEKFADSSSFAVAAEAIYGKGFEVTTSTSGFIDLVNKSREQESRFTVGMLCADQSFKVACMMGLGLVDSTADTFISYAYRVVANYTDSTNIHEDGYVFVDFKTGNFIPRVFGISHYVNEGQVTITFPYEPFKGIYTNFELERSIDKINFRTVIGKNYYSVSTTEDDQQYNIYNDSVKQEEGTYYYRLRGKTPFDAYGPYSDTIEVKIMPTIDGAPWITDIKETDDKLSIAWNIDSINVNNLKGFMVYSSTEQNGPFNPLLDNNIDRNGRYVYLQKPQDYSYYRVAAIDHFDRPYFSSSRLFQAKDTIPPLAPIGLRGEFDSTGTVKLQWNYGKEPDLLGYQLLFSANSDSEYSLLSKDFIFDSTYTTKFPLNLLSSELYFKAVALDTRYNTSKASESIVLLKPDTIPPSSPLLIVRTDSTGRNIVSIAPSCSNDIVMHRLLFQNSNNFFPQEIFRGTIKADTVFLLDNTENGILFCEAIDISGRKGVSAKIPIYSLKNGTNQLFKIHALPDVDKGVLRIYWDKEEKNGSIMIYRKMDNGKYSLIATVESDSGEFVDSNVIVNNRYCYKLIFSCKNGTVIVGETTVILK